MVGDIIYLQTADGEQLFVPDDEVKFLTYGNFGAPPVTFLTRKGYQQHGVTEVDYLLEPRTITAELWHSPACSRQQYWDNRLALHEYLRHNRGGPLLFVLRQPGGSKRALVVRANPGLQFPMPGTDINNWNVDEAVDFLANDPIWFDPDGHSELVVSALDLNLVFPITFPIRFGIAGSLSSISITYAGTWVSYPTLTLYGPYSQCIIDNMTTGVRITLSVAITGAERRILTLTPGEHSLVDGFGANRFSDLDVSSDLVDFCLRPDPEVAGGVNVIQATFVGGTVGVSGMQIGWHDRYFAI